MKEIRVKVTLTVKIRPPRAGVELPSNPIGYVEGMVRESLCRNSPREIYSLDFKDIRATQANKRLAKK